MKATLILKNFKTGTYSVKNFKDEDEAIQWWNNFPDTMKWEVIYLGTDDSILTKLLNDKKQMIVETVLILKNFKTGAYSVKNFKDEDEAIQWWYSFSNVLDWDVVYLGDNNSVY